MNHPKGEPQFLVKDGKPTAVLLDIDTYQEILERLEDMEDLESLRRARQQPLEFRSLDEFVEEQDGSA